MKRYLFCLFVFLVISVFVFSQNPELEIAWESKDSASTVFSGVIYEKVWSTALDVLLFEKPKLKGFVFKVEHETVTVEKNTGLIIVNGFMQGYLKYRLKVVIKKKDGDIEVKCKCSSWPKRVIEWFLKTTDEKLKEEQ